MFQKIGVDTVEDLIRYYPKGFEIFEDPISVGEVEEGKVCTVQVWFSAEFKYRQILKCRYTSFNIIEFLL